MFAYHTEDPTSENDLKQHKFRGSRSILLLNNMDKKQINETGWKSFVLNNKNVRRKCLLRIDQAKVVMMMMMMMIKKIIIITTMIIMMKVMTKITIIIMAMMIIIMN